VRCCSRKRLLAVTHTHTPTMTVRGRFTVLEPCRRVDFSLGPHTPRRCGRDTTQTLVSCRKPTQPCND